MISSFVRALISVFKARRELVPADELNRRHKLAEPHSVASNGANAINDAHIINHDEEHGADLAPTDDLYGVLRTIGIDVADLLNALGRLHTRVRRLATRHAPSHALLARAGRPFRRKVLADNQQFIAKLEKTEVPAPCSGG